MNLNTMRTLLSGKTKLILSRKFPKLKLFYNRRFVLNSIGLKKFIVNDTLHLGKGLLPKELFYNPKLSGWLNSEFIDIVCPLLPNKTGVTQYPFLEGPYELGNVKIKDGDVVFDCGASMGLFSVMCANFECTCYAFEPLPRNFEWLNTLAKLNPHIIPVAYAVSDKCDELWFDDSESTSVFTKISAENLSRDKIRVESITLDSFVEKNKINKVDFIKADIEGAERLLLKGARNILKEFAPRLSICKYHRSDDPKVLRQLILEGNPNYVLEEKHMKIYAYVPYK